VSAQGLAQTPFVFGEQSATGCCLYEPGQPILQAPRPTHCPPSDTIWFSNGPSPVLGIEQGIGAQQLRLESGSPGWRCLDGIQAPWFPFQLRTGLAFQQPKSQLPTVGQRVLVRESKPSSVVVAAAGGQGRPVGRCRCCNILTGCIDAQTRNSCCHWASWSAWRHACRFIGL